MSSFPSYALREGDRVLDLFCAHFRGDNTTAHVVPYVTKYTGIDLDQAKLSEQQDRYTQSRFSFICADVYEVIETLPVKSDVVISDQWTNQNELLYSKLPKLCNLANRYVIVSTNIQSMALLPQSVAGFDLECLWWRSEYLGGTYWAVYRKR